MNLKLRDVPGILIALDRALGDEKQRYPVKTAYWLARTFQDLQSHNATLEKTKGSLIARYAVKKDGKPEAFDDGRINFGENEEAVNKEYGELLDQEIEIKMEPLSLDQLGDTGIAGDVMLGLLPLVKE